MFYHPSKDVTRDYMLHKPSKYYNQIAYEVCYAIYIFTLKSVFSEQWYQFTNMFPFAYSIAQFDKSN